jgi:predicted RNA binding protein YcfA (HicA-like mRNA interferase family)
MGRRTFSGREVVKLLVNAGGFEWRRTTGDHAQLYYEHPTNEDDRRRVTVPLHDELRYRDASWYRRQCWCERLRGVA